MSYKDKRVFVTGAGGFIGSHLVEALLNEGATVRGLCRYTSTGKTGFLSPHSHLEVSFVDVKDRGFIRREVGEFQPDVIFHLAALIGIPYSYDAPQSYLDVNVGGAMGILEAASAHLLNYATVVMTSTSEVYGSALYTPIDEDHPLQAQSPYAASKIASDKLAESYHKAFGLPVVTVRPFNTFGPRQSARAVIPTIIHQLLTQDKLTLGSVSPKRDMLYVADTVRGFLMAGDDERWVGKTVNLGTGVSHSIGHIAETLMTLCEKHVPIITTSERVRPENSEVKELLADYSLARSLGWEPKTMFVQGLDEVIKYVKQHLSEYKGTYAI